MTFLEAFDRANSHFRYWRYRRQIKRPGYSFATACRDWCARVIFELRHNWRRESSHSQDLSSK